MRIAWLGPQPLEGGGVPQLASLLIKSLAEADVAVDVYVASHCSTPGRITIEHANVRWFEHQIKWDPERFRRVPMLWFLSGQRARARAQSALIDRLAATHATHPYDVVYQFSQIELLRLSRFSSTLPPIILHPETHAMGELRWLWKERQIAGHGCAQRLAWAAATGLQTARSFVQRRSLRRAAGIVSPSRIFAQHLHRDYGVPTKKLHVVPNVVDLGRFDAGPATTRDDGPIRVLFVSRIAVRKGVEQVVELSNRLADLAGQVSIDIIGSQSVWSDYRHLLRGVNGDVANYQPHMGQAELRHAYRTADLFVAPSRYEPFGLTVAEALASGVPIIASDEVGAVEGVNGDCCFTFPAGNLDAFEGVVRERIAQLQGGERRALSALCRSEAERLFSDSLVGERLRAVIVTILDAGRNGGVA